MDVMSIECIDKIGLSIDEDYHQIKFEMGKKYINDHEKIKGYCLNKYNELYNPKYPYFFVKLNEILPLINCNIVIKNSIASVELDANNQIYKLKFVGLCNNPVYCLCTNLNSFQEIIKMLYQKYSACSYVTFKFNNVELKMNTMIKNCGFNTRTINEIHCIIGNLLNMNMCGVICLKESNI